MSLPQSGIMSASMISKELGREENAHFSLGEEKTRSLAGKPQGTISFADFRGKSSEVVVTLSNRSDVTILQNLFEKDLWQSETTKRVFIPREVEIGIQQPRWAALKVGDDPWGGQLVLDVAGTITGGCGAMNGGTGGTAVHINRRGNANQKLTLHLTGTIRSGGGGGGRGGNGGRGYVNYEVREPNTGELFDGNSYSYCWEVSVRNNSSEVFWLDDFAGGTGDATHLVSPVGWNYYRGSYQGTYDDGFTDYHTYAVWRTKWRQDHYGGGMGGLGGAGAGYGNPASSGGRGSYGAGNSGSGGNGGDGGDYGCAGNTGATGANGNVASGQSGSKGGAAGLSILGMDNVNLINQGTLLGPTE